MKTVYTAKHRYRHLPTDIIKKMTAAKPSPTERALFLLLCWRRWDVARGPHVGKATGITVSGATTTNAWLCHCLGIDERALRRALHNLERAKLIAKHTREGEKKPVAGFWTIPGWTAESTFVKLYENEVCKLITKEGRNFIPLFLALAHFMNRETGLCNPKVSTIAKQLGITERGARYQLAEAVEAGMVSVGTDGLFNLPNRIQRADNAATLFLPPARIPSLDFREPSTDDSNMDDINVHSIAPAGMVCHAMQDVVSWFTAVGYSPEMFTPQDYAACRELTRSVVTDTDCKRMISAYFDEFADTVDVSATLPCPAGFPAMMGRYFVDNMQRQNAKVIAIGFRKESA